MTERFKEGVRGYCEAVDDAFRILADVRHDFADRQEAVYRVSLAKDELLSSMAELPVNQG